VSDRVRGSVKPHAVVVSRARAGVGLNCGIGVALEMAGCVSPPGRTGRPKARWLGLNPQHWRASFSVKRDGSVESRVSVPPGRQGCDSLRN
jgi:hypothetical protein